MYSTRKRAPNQATNDHNEQYPQSLPRGGEDERLARTDTSVQTRTDTRLTRRLTQTTLTRTAPEVRCQCGKICKNTRGLKIHQAKTKCGKEAILLQRRVETPRQTQENPSQEAPHSTGDLLATALPLNHTVVNSDASQQPQPAKDRIKWPKMNSNKEWQQLDEDLCKILETALVGAAEQKMATMTAIIYNVAKERFGVEDRKTSTPNVRQPNRREKEMQSLRREIKALSRQFKNATEGEKEGIRDLTSGLREQLRRLRRAEQTRKQRKKKGAKRAQFIKDPYRFTKTLLGEARSGSLSSSKEEVEEALRLTHCDPQRYELLSSHPKIIKVPPPSEPLVTREPTWKEVEEVVKKARTASAPGPSGVPYKVYKKCPLLLRRLWKLFRTIWAKGSIPTTWRVSEGCFVPKEKDSSEIGQFRAISLLSVEAKIFFSVLARRITNYMSCLAGPRKCIWFHAPFSHQQGYGAVPHPRQDQADD
ncbi:uncharacterized protein LOC119796966 [Cyprinodon tularosa]|uniref:uncharacterized protein LOC119795268 n=1 Tax=Cyprinodon tularosa TaxID=77115 RepID=UPI0018E1DCDE|nr:uncharacterized protein LOC119795268 [Cyprinodon tularosa]XP_038161696.1 uncharacterized protein LOC119796966 [Cyprinodon tularosa]